ncbi:hypothetical protein, variant 1 [Aphanomyces astaci]|uniref:Uncharacterized protein n=1 Tax=Aphanomyces astaci TaxID=112090 RepID=W4FW27_APHAT|nr:hypothetical protein, variant 1 [Aphanomyces astaci]ETV71682.1 hypothetical protein, variant 1 [Aphanomyces astaci]|eukprot:XP_009838871.1 hypothetical protein, variant 1 [Aphanomyces astaci]
MDALMIDALDTMPLEEALAATFDVDAMLMDDFDLFAPLAVKNNMSAAKVLSSSRSQTDTASMSSDQEAPTPLGDDAANRPKKINHSRKRQREELEYLRSKVNELEQHLRIVGQVKAMEIVNETPWQQMANQMRIAKQTALNENDKLKHELEEQIEFGKALQTLMKKRPKLTVLPTLENEQWRVLKLVKDPVLRRHAIHEIYEQQYRLTDGVLVEGGLLDQVDDMEAYVPRLAKCNADLVLQVAFCKTKRYDFNVVSEMAWALFQGGCGAKKKQLTYEMIEKIDYNSAYVGIELHWNDLANQANCLYKRFTEPDRDVIVCRSVLEDELHPFREGALVLNKSAWLVIERLDNGKACRLKFFQKSTLPMLQSNHGTRSLSDPASRYFRVGTVTDSVLLSLKSMIADFSEAMDTLLANYNGNVADTFHRVNLMMDK